MFAAPLKGIPSRSIPSGGFRSNPVNSTMATPARPGVRKDCGIKILEITEQPIGYAQAKKRKKAGKLILPILILFKIINNLFMTSFRNGRKQTSFGS